MKIVSPLAVLFITLLSNQAVALTVEAGASQEFYFDTQAGHVYELTTQVSSCGESEVCCQLLVGPANQTITPLILDESSARQGSGQMALVFDGYGSVQAKAIVYGVRQCTFSVPQITEQTKALSQADAFSFGTGIGQISGVYTDISTTQASVDNDAYYLRDLSRRRSLSTVSNNPNQGDFEPYGEISTHRYVGVHTVEQEGVNYESHLTYPISLSVNDWSSEAVAVDAHRASGLVYDYLREILNHNSFDDQGADMISMVDWHFPSRPTQFCGQTIPANSLWNAAWNGVSIAFTPADMTDWRGNYRRYSLSSALDVVAHEWGHAVSDNYAQFAYERESGALSEAFSDWLGAAVEHYAGQGNWTLGEQIQTLRSMSNPTLYGDPEIYQGQNWVATDIARCPVPDICENDYCGVHFNSGVANKMFYLLSVGGTFNGVSLDGVGIDTAMQIAFDALRFYWTENTGFAEAGEGMYEAAKNYGDLAPEQVKLAWQAVGVSVSEEEPVTEPSPSVASSGGGGGCSLQTNATQGVDPLLWVLVIMSCGYLWRNRHSKGESH